MAGLIKKQILKHLSKFAKNLSADSIQLSTLKGEGELNDLQLDCIAIQNLLDLPTWLQINHATCNRVHVKIPWTKLKVSPIIIFLDYVDMDMVTCETPRPPNGPSPIEASATGGESSYGFIQKVLEGITLRINAINVNFKSKVFTAEFQLSQLMMYSTDPEGRKADLRFSRIVNDTLKQVLTFKKVTWQTMRIVSDAASVRTGGITTPIRLITNQAMVEIVLRRKLSDLSVLATKLRIKFDDLLWVLTDAQVQSALLCVKSIKDTIERSKQQGRKLQQNSSFSKQFPSPPITPLLTDVKSDHASNPLFFRHIIHETSYHCDVGRIDLHICDDGSSPNVEASYKKVVEGGAILITLLNLKMDHYPMHPAGKGRSYFRGYNDIASSRDKWAEDIIAQFRKDFLELKKVSDLSVPLKSGAKLLESCLLFKLTDIDISEVTATNDTEKSSHKLLSSDRASLHLPDDFPLATFIITDYYYPDGRDYPAPHNNIFARLNAPHLRTHWPSLIWINQLVLSTFKSVQKMLKDLNVVLKDSIPKEEEHSDIRVETLMPKISIPLLNGKSEHNLPQEVQIQISEATVTNCRHGEHASRKSLLQFIQTIKKSYLNSNSSFPADKMYDYSVLYKLFEEHAIEGDSSLLHSLKDTSPQMKRSSLIGKAYKDVWCIWVRQVWLDFIMEERLSPKTKSIPFIDSVPVMIWICKTESALKKSSSMFSNPRKSSSLPSVSSSCDINSDIKKAPSDYNFNSNKNLEMDESDEFCSKRTTRNKTLLDFYRNTIEKDDKPTSSVCEDVEVSVFPEQFILIGSEKPINVLLDHYQFVFLQRLAKAIDNIGEKVSNDTTNILIEEANPNKTEENSNSSGVRIFLPVINFNLVLRPATAAHSTTAFQTDQNGSTTPPEVKQDTTSSQRLQTPTFPDPDTSSNNEKATETKPDSTPPCRPIAELTNNQHTITQPSERRTSRILDPLFSEVRCDSPVSYISTSPSDDRSSIDTVSVFGEDINSFSLFTSMVADTTTPATPSSRDGEKQPHLLSSSPRQPTLINQTSQIRKKANIKIFSNLTKSSGTSSSENLSDTSGVYTNGSLVSHTGSHIKDVDTYSCGSSESYDQFVILDMDSSNSTEEAFKPSKTWSPKITPLVSEPVTPTVIRPSSLADPTPQVHEEPKTETRGADPQGYKSDQELVSMFRVLAFDGIELAVDKHDLGSAVKLIVPKISLKCFRDLTLNEALSAFQKEDSSTQQDSFYTIPTLRMRIDSGQSASRVSPGYKEHMQLEVRNFKGKLSSSTLTNIGAFFEDESHSKIVPMKIDAYDVCISIEDDVDLAYPTSVRSHPVTLNVHEAHIKRDASGTFHVSSESKTAPDLLTSLHFSTNQESQFLSNQNRFADDKKKLSPNSPSNHEVFSSQPTVSSGDVTAIEVMSLQKRLNEMTQERDILARTLSTLQDELRKSEAERNKLKSFLGQK